MGISLKELVDKGHLYILKRQIADLFKRAKEGKDAGLPNGVVYYTTLYAKAQTLLSDYQNEHHTIDVEAEFPAYTKLHSYTIPDPPKRNKVPLIVTIILAVPFGLGLVSSLVQWGNHVGTWVLRHIGG